MSNDAPNLTRTLRLFRDGAGTFIGLCAALDYELSRGMSVDQLLEMLDVYELPREVRQVLETRIRAGESDHDAESAVTAPISRASAEPAGKIPPADPAATPSLPSAAPNSPSASILNYPAERKASIAQKDKLTLAQNDASHATQDPADKRFQDPIGEGFVLGDRLELHKFVGKGGNCRVYKAVDRKRGKSAPRYVAVKILNVDLRNELRALVAFESEAKISSELKHPNIVATHGYVAGDAPYIVMEFLEGETLADYVRRKDSNALSVARTLELITPIGHALTYAHGRGIVHSDVKPENIFLTTSGQVKLIDFGAARSTHGTSNAALSAQAANTATRSYASPEILELRGPDARDDVYSLASTAYKLITGDPPFGKSSAADARTVGLRLERPNGVTRETWEALQCALKLDRESRTPSIAQFLDEINAVKPRSWRPGLIAASALLVLGGIAGYALLQDSTEVRNGRELAADNTPEVVETADEASVTDPSAAGITPRPSRKSDTAGGPVAPPDAVGAVATRSERDTTLPAATGDPGTPVRPSASTAGNEAVAGLKPPEPRAASVSTSTAADTRNERRTAGAVAPPAATPASIRSTPQPRAQDVQRTAAAPTTPATIRLVTHTHNAGDETLGVTIAADIIGTARIVEAFVESSGSFVPYPMHDDGTRGDPTANDNLYHATVPLPDPTLGSRYYVAVRTAQGQTLYEPAGAALEPRVIEPVESRNGSRPTVIISEFMADNKQTTYDPQGDYDDWIELYNPTGDDVSLEGLYLSNDASKPKMWRFPDGTVIPARGHLIVWADDHSSYSRVSRNAVELHAAFELDERGGEILLIDIDERDNAVVDRVSFGRQRPDFSSARESLADDTFRNVSRGSPGRPN